MVVLEDPSKAGPLGNCSVDAASMQNHRLENGNGISMGPVRFKRRSVSAKRDFPPRCGRNALEPDAKLRAESLIVRAADLGSLVPSGVSAESELPKLSKSSDQMEPSSLLDGLKPETAGVSECLNQNTLLNNSEPEIANQSEMMGGLDRAEKDTVQLLDISAPGEAAEKIVPKKFPTRRVSCIRDFPRGCGRNAPPITPREERKKAVLMGSKKPTGDRPSTEMDGTVNAESSAGKSEGKIAKEPEAEVHLESAFRHDVTEDKTEEKTDDVQVKGATRRGLKGVDAKEIAEKIQFSTAHESKSSEMYIKSQSASKKDKREVGRSAEKKGNESGKYRKTVDPKRKFEEESVEEWIVALPCIAAYKNATASQSQGEGSVDSEYSGDKMVLDTQIAGYEKQKDAPVVDYTYTPRSVPKKRNSDRSSLRNTDSVEGKTTKKKSTMVKSASREKYKSAVKDEEDSLLLDDEGKGVLSGQKLSSNLIPFGPKGSSKSDDSDNASPRRKVKETLRMFQAICRKLLREEETKSNRPAQALGRIDLVAAKLLKEGNKCVNTGAAILGPVPGIEVGDEFSFRVELAVVGLHRPYQSGIDYTKQGKTILATSVVASGGYADDMDSSDVMIYSGQGGKPAGGDKQPEDQKLERGNLALKNSIDAKTPIRVIHGFKVPAPDARGKMTSTFTYDGLYLVEKYWQEKGDHGCAVFKFQMRRMPGQPELALKEVRKSKTSAKREGLCMEDVSQKKEKKAICVVNTVDNDRPLPFKYITKMIYPSWYTPTPPKGCDCTRGCSDSKKCVCVMKNGGEIPFNYNGAIVEAKPLVYECGPSCKCPPSCHNRVSQRGIKLQLEVFKTKLRGWGVRSLASIPSGSFICEYTGELLKDKEAEQRTGNDEYLFDIGKNLKEQSLWDGLSALALTESQSNVFEKVVEDGGYTIDAAECGNVGRFINHSCSPNLYAQNVLYDHDDKSMPHIMFFAAENIPPLQELTYHYNYTIGQVHDSNGNVKQKNCYCGSHECTGRLY
eukprot:TRINITY_DN44073_c0_g1_i1.p1 TRINITY_DN44073_c0_g1~~TRINITY_DN44073_c0_g1_i1.p1  ORF type:complete len:1013 (+),score=234.04 TRINITY_DN44073_c0_g1_i1:236-3274(+)